MKSVAGILGKTNADGSSPDSKPNSRVTAHLRDALQKPADGERLIFIDVNTPMPTDEDMVKGGIPTWMEATARQLDDRERDLKEGEKAYLFITNIPFHWHLEVETPPVMALVYGLGIPDFGRPGEFRVSDIWKSKQKHIDAHNIMESVKKYPQIPTTFDGELPLAPEDVHNRIRIGERYFFEDIGERGVIAEVTSATVSEEEKEMYLGISTVDGGAHIVTRKMNDGELEVYRRYREGFFGIVQPPTVQTADPYELFEWFMHCYRTTPREKLLEMCNGRDDLSELEKLEDNEIRLALCEAWTGTAVQSSKRSEG